MQHTDGQINKEQRNFNSITNKTQEKRHTLYFKITDIQQINKKLEKCLWSR